MASLVAQLINDPPAMQEAWVRSLGWEDSLEKGMASVFWPGEFLGLYSPWGHKESDTNKRLSLHFTSPRGRKGQYHLQVVTTLGSYPRVNHPPAEWALEFLWNNSKVCIRLLRLSISIEENLGLRFI